jgi:hypothetical protein
VTPGAEALLQGGDRLGHPAQMARRPSDVNTAPDDATAPCTLPGPRPHSAPTTDAASGTNPTFSTTREIITARYLCAAKLNSLR